MLKALESKIQSLKLVLEETALFRMAAASLSKELINNEIYATAYLPFVINQKPLLWRPFILAF